ncbi:MAG: putative NEK protein kinase [Streblomastix strix]|uniref:non-specific serine/threonine protein kinase n=1 Tax=Streblomastix strix TaxID=222440 RepID=A0A5J4UDW4_9EUKA|nr:MAG: putative NEK protein kinase [Streblomastix strix]
MQLCLILEYCKNGDLRKIITDLQKLPIEERINRVWDIFAQITLALDFLHSNQVVHRDIKPENIFLMEDGTIRLGDFGLAKELTEKYYATIAGTKFYLAAEVWLQNRMTYMSDMFAFGVVLFELLTGQHPFQASNEQAEIDKIKKGQHSNLPDWVPQEMRIPIISMLSSV